MFPILSTFYKFYRQDSGFLFLIPHLKRFIVSTSFIFAGILSQIFRLKYLILSLPQFTILTFGRVKSDQLLGLHWPCCLKGKISVTISGAIPLYILYISVERALRFLWWIETQLSLSSISWKEDFLSLYSKRRHLSWSVFILLLFVRFWPTQISWQ